MVRWGDMGRASRLFLAQNSWPWSASPAAMGFMVAMVWTLASLEQLLSLNMDLVTAKTKLAEVGFNQGHAAVSLSPSGLLAFFLHPQSRPALGAGLDIVREMVSKLNACQNRFREDCGDWD